MKICEAIILVSICISCASCLPNSYKIKKPSKNTLKLRLGEKQIERGEAFALVDMPGKYLFSLPSKLILLNAKMNNHELSLRNEQELRKYLIQNNLDDVKVRINQYAPGDEFSRLVRNKDVHWGWKYTLGLLSWTIYTLVPDRLFAGTIGGDSYNPFTNTINIYSDHESVALHEAAHAKDFMDSEITGFYTLLRIIPFVAIFQEYIASEDVLVYFNSQNNKRGLDKSKKLLFPALGTYLGGSINDTLPNPTYFVSFAVVYLTHVITRISL